MPNTLNVVKADLSIESAYIRPEFGLFRDTPGLLGHLFVQLQRHGLQLQNMKIERGTSNSFGDFHVECHMYGFRLGVSVYADKVGVVCVNVMDNELEKISSAIVGALSAVKQHQPTVEFRTHTMVAALHGTLEGRKVRDYLSTFVRNVPDGLGPHTGNGGVIYFGPVDDRVLSTMTIDFSAVVSDGLFVRPYAVWDATRVDAATLPTRATTFIREALNVFGLEIPALRPS